MSNLNESVDDAQAITTSLSRILTLLQAVVCVLAGGGFGFAIAWVVSFMVYVGTYNSGYVLRVETLGSVIGACLGFLVFAELVEEKVRICPRVRVGFLLLGIWAILCSEWYFFGIGEHRTAVTTVYRAGGGIERNWRGQVTAVELIGRPSNGFAGDDFALLAEFPQMTRLKMWWPDIGVVEAQHIARCTQLESLTIFGSLTPTGEQITDDRAIEKLRPLVNLEELKLAYTGISDAALPVLNAFSQLRTLNLTTTPLDKRNERLEFSDVTDAGVTSLRLPRLVKLNLSGTQIGDTGVAHLVRMATFEELDLSETQITDAAIAALGSQDRLREVVLCATQVSGPGFEGVKNLTRLDRLNLCGANTGDGDLRWVAGLADVRTLQLSRTLVTDVGLQHIEGLSGLRYVSLEDTSVSREAVARLRAKLPNCNVDAD